MPSRRQEKVAKVIKEAVSDAVANRLSDPRIVAFVSVTRVEVAADMRTANVYFSIFGGDEAAQNRTFAGITHARSRIQAFVADAMQSKFCPVLHFFKDEQFKKTLETLRKLDQLNAESKNKPTGNVDVSKNSGTQDV